MKLLAESIGCSVMKVMCLKESTLVSSRGTHARDGSQTRDGTTKHVWYPLSAFPLEDGKWVHDGQQK